MGLWWETNELGLGLSVFEPYHGSSTWNVYLMPILYHVYKVHQSPPYFFPTVNYEDASRKTVITERNNYQNFISATDVKIPATPEKKITVIEDKPVQAQSVESVKEAIQHGVHVQEMRMKEYLLPILLGAGVGFILLVLCVSLLVCCCCKRKLKKKMKMAKEMEKSSKDGKSIIDLVQGYGGVGVVHIL